MGIPVATTTIKVSRIPADPDRDPLDEPPASEVIASGVRAHISTSRGREAPEAGGSQEVVYFRMSCDPSVELHHHDTVEDENTGEVYDVEWARLRRGLGLEHVQAGLRQVSGMTTANPRGFV